MKKIIFIMIAILISVNAYAVNIYLGPKAGCGFGLPQGDDYSNIQYDADVVLNYSAGLMFDLQIKRFGIYALGIQPEVLYNRSGYKFTRSSNKGNSVDFSFHAVELPVYFKQKFRVGKGDIFFSMGLNFLILVGDYELNATRDYRSYDLSEFYTTDYAFGIGFVFGYAFDLNVGNLGIGVSLTPYARGFADDNSVRHYKVALELSFAFKLL